MEKYKTGFRRFWAAIVDSLPFIPFIIANGYIRDVVDNKSLILCWIIFQALFSIFYSVFLHYKFGQTLGKWAVNVKVVNVDETRNLTLKQALLRDIFYILLQIASLLYLIAQLYSPDGSIPEVLENYDNFGGDAAVLWIIIELISMLTNDKRRAVHDFIAGSVVIRTDYEK